MPPPPAEPYIGLMLREVALEGEDADGGHVLIVRLLGDIFTLYQAL
jgi:hypothetical protein